MKKKSTPPSSETSPRPQGPSTRSKRGLRSMLIEASPDALIALKPDGTILFWSTGAENVYGYTKEDAVGMRLHDLVAPTELIEQSEQFTHGAIERGLVVRETVHYKKDGSMIYVNVTAKAVRDHNGN